MSIDSIYSLYSRPCASCLAGLSVASSVNENCPEHLCAPAFQRLAGSSVVCRTQKGGGTALRAEPGPGWGVGGTSLEFGGEVLLSPDPLARKLRSREEGLTALGPVNGEGAVGKEVRAPQPVPGGAMRVFCACVCVHMCVCLVCCAAVRCTAYKYGRACVRTCVSMYV